MVTLEYAECAGKATWAIVRGEREEGGQGVFAAATEGAVGRGGGDGGTTNKEYCSEVSVCDG